MTNVGKMDWWLLLLYFVGYILLHFIIIKTYMNKLEQLKINPNDEKLKKYLNIHKYLSKWFPAVYMIFLLIMLI